MMHFHSTMPLVGGYLIAMTFCNIIQNIRRSSTISVLSRLKPRVEAASAFCTQSLPKPHVTIPPLLTRAKTTECCLLKTRSIPQSKQFLPHGARDCLARSFTAASLLIRIEPPWASSLRHASDTNVSQTVRLPQPELQGLSLKKG
jgi:hypothetical protein